MLDYEPGWFTGRGFDPSAGDGRMIRTLIERGNAGPHFLNEIREDERLALEALPNCSVTIGDYVTMEAPPVADFLLTNPPFTLAQAFVEKARQHVTGPICILQSLAWQGSRGRRQWFTAAGLAKVLILPDRPRWEVDSGRPPMNLYDYGWFVFMPGWTSPPTLEWLGCPRD